MPRKPENPGTCVYCGEIILRRSVNKHLEKCQKRQAALEQAATSNRPVETLWYLRVQDAYLKDFWLDLEMVSSASLDKLDKYLRAIWLECCGHLSNSPLVAGGAEIGKARIADSIFEPDLVLRHLYDFGTTSETDIKVMGMRVGQATSKHPIALLAAIRYRRPFARSVIKRLSGCVSNACTKKINPASCAMSMQRSIHMMTTEVCYL